MSETKKFKTETKRLLELMINSIYTNKEIFLRELIANASDAIDKHRLLSLSGKAPLRDEYKINVEIDKDNRLIKISDNGVGMNHDELIENLGTIAKSGSKEFLQKLENDELSDSDAKEIIGQFGVGFYSAYLVADEVEVLSKTDNDPAYIFSSKGIESYNIDTCEKDEPGTIVILHLKENSEDFNYDEFLEEYKIRVLIKKYSDFIRYPIHLKATSMEKVYDEEGNDTGEMEERSRDEVINSMIPIWKKDKAELTDKDYQDFYQAKFYDYNEALDYIHYNTEGLISYTALLYLPKKAPYDLYTANFEKGLQLYSKGVLIMDKCKDLLPDYLRFVRGVVDSSDFSLNISREILQQDKQLSKIAANIEKKILKKLSDMQTDEREKYEEFFNTFGLNLKFGIYNNFGEKKEQLQDLIMYNTLNEEKMITLKEYCDNLKDDQKAIYYVSAKDKAQVLNMPQMDALKKKGYDVLILSDEIDEFVIKILEKYNDTPFKSINQGDLDLLTDEEEKALEETKQASSTLLSKIKDALSGSVSDVVLSKRLDKSPVCLVSSDGISFEMEKVLNNLPNQEANVKAGRILEINPNHEIFNLLKENEENPEKLAKYAKVLYNQALIMEGFTPDDPNDFLNTMCDIMLDK